MRDPRDPYEAVMNENKNPLTASAKSPAFSNHGLSILLCGPQCFA